MASTFTPMSPDYKAQPASTGGGWQQMLAQLMGTMGGGQQQQQPAVQPMPPLNLSKSGSGWMDALNRR